MSIAQPDEKVSLAMQDVAQGLTDLLEEIAGQPMLFSLVVFQTKENSRMNYVSNADREEVKNALKSLIKGWEEGMPDIPAHNYRG